VTRANRWFGFNVGEFFLSVLVIGLLSFFVFLSEIFIFPTYSIIVSLFFIVLGICFFSFVIKRFGGVFIFLTLFSLVTIYVPEIGLTSWNKVIAFALTGIIYELSNLILKLFLKSILFRTILSTTISLTILPLISVYLLSASIANTFPLSMLNLLILVFIVSFVSSLLISIIWFTIRNKKSMLKFETSIGSLGRR